MWWFWPGLSTTKPAGGGEHQPDGLYDGDADDVRDRVHAAERGTAVTAKGHQLRAEQPHPGAAKGDDVVAPAGDQEPGQLSPDGRDQHGEDDARAHGPQPSDEPPRREKLAPGGRAVPG